MKKKIVFGVVALAFSAAASAAPIRIDDNYVGANSHSSGDVIGDATQFQISHMNVDYTGTQATVTVFSNYHDGAAGTNFGDLFISSNGWHPFGAAPYAADDAGNGEAWELVFDTSEGKIYGGNFSILLAENVVSGTVRDGQEVLRGGGGTLKGTGSVTTGSAFDAATNKTWNTVAYTFDWAALGIVPGDDMGLRWEMTCANDVIEGVAPTPVRPNDVPLPGSALLMGAGLLAWRRTVRK